MERNATDQHSSPLAPQLPLTRDTHSQSSSSIKVPLKWKLDGFKNDNAPIMLLVYKNRKWKNFNNFVTIRPTVDPDMYTVTLVRMDRRERDVHLR